MSKKVFITGGIKGIGKAIAIAFAQHHYDLYLNFVKEDDKALQTKLELEQQYSVSVTLIKADISHEEEVKRIATIFENKTIDVLINNAGIAIDTVLEDKTVENFQKILNINTIGPFLTSKYIGNLMMTQGYGKIINIISTNAIDTYYPESMDYDASKAALLSLTHNFAKAYAPNVSVNAVAVGWVETEMNQNMDLEYKKREEEKILLKRFAQPQEIANVVCFLATEEANYIQNTVIRVDGGKVN